MLKSARVIKAISLIKMHGFMKKVNSFGKTALTAAGTAHTLFQAGKAAYDFGKVAAPVIAGLL